MFNLQNHRGFAFHILSVLFYFCTLPKIETEIEVGTKTTSLSRSKLSFDLAYCCERITNFEDRYENLFMWKLLDSFPFKPTQYCILYHTPNIQPDKTVHLARCGQYFRECLMGMFMVIFKMMLILVSALQWPFLSHFWIMIRCFQTCPGLTVFYQKY